MMLRWTVPVERGNETVADGSMLELIEVLLEDLKPEAAYFWPEAGERGGLMVFDMAEASDMVPIAERLFAGIDAEVEFTPVMNPDDLRAGVPKAMS